MPALGKVRKHALEVKCAANLRSMGQALTMYTQQYGYYPGGSLYAPPTGEYALWPVRLRAFMGGDQTSFYCPSADERCEWKKDGPAPYGRATAHQPGFGYEAGEPLLDWARSFFSYGYNAWGAGGVGVDDTFAQRGLGPAVMPRHLPLTPRDRDRYREMRVTRVRRPARTIAIADSTPDGFWDFGVLPNVSDGRHGHLPRWVGTLHRGGANFLFCDGHVEWYPRSEHLLDGQRPDKIEKRAIWCMWNNDHEPHYD
jgi:prepilin-type processing-associated H-X9-DG protein